MTELKKDYTELKNHATANQIKQLESIENGTATLNEDYKKLVDTAAQVGVFRVGTRDQEKFSDFLLELQNRVTVESIKKFNKDKPGEPHVATLQQPETPVETAEKNASTFRNSVNKTIITYLEGPMEGEYGHHADASVNGDMHWTVMSNQSRTGRVVYEQEKGEITSFSEDINKVWMQEQILKDVVGKYVGHLKRADEIAQKSMDSSTLQREADDANRFPPGYSGPASTLTQKMKYQGDADVENKKADSIVTSILSRAFDASNLSPEMKEHGKDVDNNPKAVAEPLNTNPMRLHQQKGETDPVQQPKPEPQSSNDQLTPHDKMLNQIAANVINQAIARREAEQSIQRS